MDPKPHPNQREYLKALRAMTPDERLRKAFELTELGRTLFREGLRRLHPRMAEDELRRLYLDKIAKCHNKTY
jgi:DNA-binding PadR family transcriptional regulator